MPRSLTHAKCTVQSTAVLQLNKKAVLKARGCMLSYLSRLVLGKRHVGLQAVICQMGQAQLHCPPAGQWLQSSCISRWITDVPGQ
jgi:hypothetical protein